jgi:hypothetical protein
MRPFPTIFSNDHSHTTISIRHLLRPFPHEFSHSTTPIPGTTTPIQYPSYSLFKRPFSNDQSHTRFFKQPFPYGHSHITIRTRPFSYDHSHATILIRPPLPYNHHLHTTTHIRSTPTTGSIRPFPYDHSPCRSPPHPSTPRNQNFTSASLGQPSRDETISFDSPGCMYRSPGRTQEAMDHASEKKVLVYLQ